MRPRFAFRAFVPAVERGRSGYRLRTGCQDWEQGRSQVAAELSKVGLEIEPEPMLPVVAWDRPGQVHFRVG